MEKKQETEEVYIMAAIEEYRKVEAEFENRTDCLCECIPPVSCDYSKCPAQEQCKWLCANDPFQ